MDLIIDANVLFAALIKDSTSVDLIFSDNIRLFAPEFLLLEFKKHKEEILNKTKRTEKEFNEIFTILESLITLIPKEDFQEFMKKAKDISPDEDDIHYFALALKLNLPIWSNDKKLKEQNLVKIYSTEEINSLN
ncbi:MAG: PIN domain-containing protein [Nanoarchaeota archaeon]